MCRLVVCRLKGRYQYHLMMSKPSLPNCLCSLHALKLMRCSALRQGLALGCQLVEELAASGQVCGQHGLSQCGSCTHSAQSCSFALCRRPRPSHVEHRLSHVPTPRRSGHSALLASSFPLSFRGCSKISSVEMQARCIVASKTSPEGRSMHSQ